MIVVKGGKVLSHRDGFAPHFRQKTSVKREKCQSMLCFTFEHPRGGENRVPRKFWSNLGLLQRRPDLAAKGRYTITSDVGREVVDLFFARVMEDETAVATAENAEQLRALCDELGFAGFDDGQRGAAAGALRRARFRGLRRRAPRSFGRRLEGAAGPRGPAGPR